VIGVSRLSMNQVTVSRLSLTQTLDLCLEHEIPGVGLWRDRVAELGIGESAAAVRRSGLRVSSLCRGGFFTHADPAARRAALADNLAAVEEAAALRADTLILVSGGLVPRARDLGVRLGIEALHPMFCADRCVLTRLADAVDLAMLFPADTVGVVVDTYHVWWDSRIAADIARARGRIVAYQVCDWVVPLPTDMLLGRGHLGDGVIDFGPISQHVLAAGYDGFVEVEIMNQDIWDAPASQTATTVKTRFAALLG
jgi:sugar phosphate isomerase/epimerase